MSTLSISTFVQEIRNQSKVFDFELSFVLVEIIQVKLHTWNMYIAHMMMMMMMTRRRERIYTAILRQARGHPGMLHVHVKYMHMPILTNST